MAAIFTLKCFEQKKNCRDQAPKYLKKKPIYKQSKNYTYQYSIVSETIFFENFFNKLECQFVSSGNDVLGQ